jgi:hypothetical protein
MEAEAQAVLRGGDDPKEFPGQNFIVGRSIGEDYFCINFVRISF